MKGVVVDFETASRADLMKIGAWKYAADMTTFPLCLSLKLIIDKRPQPAFCLSEKMLHALDPRLMELAKDPDVIFLAHNAGFEQAMWHFHCVPMGYPPLPPEKWHDTMAVAAMKALPLGLDAVVMALELPVKKDMEGHAHMLKMCKPDKDDGWSHHTPENLERLYTYCNGDVDAQYGVYVSTQGLGPSERSTWILDQTINQRGIRIDTDFVDACIDVLDQVRVPMTARFRKITGLNPTQREKVLNWVNDQGVPLGDMRKATLNAILDADDEFAISDFQEPLPYHIHEVLTLRRALASSSVAKLERMLQCAGSDGRVRYTTQYHGARTGRDAGRLIQVQNYPVGEIGDRQGLTADLLADAILTRDVDHIREIWGPDIFSAVISSLRSCIVAEKGKVLVTADYAAVECRNLLSMAGQHDRVDQMHSGQDVYSEVASMIFKRPINRKLPEHYKEGKIGKQTTLGCLGACTLTLTHTGYKPIKDVLDTDLLWDGESWITHKGLAFRGFKETLSFCGLRMTPDHPVFIGDRWSPAAALTEKSLFQALAFAKAHGPYSDMATARGGVSKGLFAGATVGMARRMWTDIISQKGNLAGAIHAGVKKFAQGPHTAHLRRYVRTIFIGGGSLGGFRELYSAVTTQKIPVTETMVVEESNSIFWMGRQPYLILSRLMGGMTPLSKLIASIMMGIMKPGIYALLCVLKIIRTKDRFINCRNSYILRSKKLKCLEPVYDLVDAGPNHRFTVLTLDGPLIVHNSGYGLGPVGFRARFAPKESIELAKLAIDTYRKEFAPKVVLFWWGLYQASVDAVWCSHAKTYSYAGFEFRREGDFLTMRLLSGRKIYYHRPRKEKSYDPSGNEHAAWSFMSYQGKKFRRHLAWHGMITADATQGGARDLLKGFEKRAHSAGLFTIFRVHDELVFEETDRNDLCEVVKQIAEDIEPWALERKFRVKAEVSKMLRYAK